MRMERKLSKIYTSCSWLFYILLLVLCAVFNTSSADEISSSPITPAKVIDGDSIEIGNRSIRLMGIDAPEYKQYCKNHQQKKYPCGKKATEHLRNLINNQNIRCIIHKKDQYDRDLCTCYSGTRNLNAEMVKSGYAVIYMESPYQNEQKEAKAAKRGIWQGKFIQPRLFRILKEREKSN